MLPLLRLAGDGEIHTVAEAVDHLAEHFGLTEKIDEKCSRVALSVASTTGLLGRGRT